MRDIKNIDLMGLAEYIAKYNYTLAQTPSPTNWYILQEPRFRIWVDSIGPDDRNFFAAVGFMDLEHPDKPTEYVELDDWLDELEKLAFFHNSMAVLIIGD